MKYLPKALLLVAVLGLAACNNPDRYGAGGKGGANGAGGIDSMGLGDAGNPRSVAYFQQTVGDRVLFPVDQSSLTDEARGILAQQATWLLTNADYAIIIEGHADEQGTREYNQSLSERRANSAKEFLVSQGVAASRMVVYGYGKERPLEVCSEESCYAKNRRAVTVLSAGAGA